MAAPLVPDDLWERIRPLIPVKPRRRRHPGRKPIDPRKALTAIVFVLKTGIPWEHLPRELGCGSGMTAWRYLRAWQRAGVWEKIHKTLLDRLRGAEKIDGSRAAVDSSSVRAVGGGEKTGPNPTDRGLSGSKHHVLTDGGGAPLAVSLTAANRHDVTELVALVDKVPPVAGSVGHPRRRPLALVGDRA
jgi:transposase